MPGTTEEVAVTEHLTGAATEPNIPIGWKGTLAPLDKLSGDRRVLASPPDGQPRVRPLPLPMGYQDTLAAGHDGAYVVSSIDDVWTQDGMLKGRGRFDLADERAVEAARKLAEGYMRWVSVDLDDTTTTLAVACPVLGPDASGEADSYAITPIDADTFDQTQLAENDKLVEVATDWRLMGATLVSQPAFAEAVIEPVYDEAEFEDDLDDDEIALLDAMVADGTLDAVVHGDADELSASDPAAAGMIPADTGVSLELTGGIDTFTVSGDTGLSFAPRDHAWDGNAAKARILAWADGDASKMAKAFLYRDPNANPATRSAYKFPIADVVGGELRLVLGGIRSAAAMLGKGDIPEPEKQRMRGKLTTLYRRAAKHFKDPDIKPPWASGGSGGSSTSPRQSAAVDSGCGCTSLLAAASPAAPPAAWFDDPQLPGPAPIEVDDDGRVRGHLATWGTCHTGFPGSCVPPPRNHSGYAYFHVGVIRTAEGTELPVGTIVLDTDHAHLSANHHAAMAHYADTGRAAAAVRVGEDDHGIWVAGTVLPGLDDDKVATLRRSPLSGDWRVIGGRQELVAALAVNTPGFPIPRAKTGVDGHPWSLVAAGAVPRHTGPMTSVVSAMSALAVPLKQLARDIATELDGLSRQRVGASEAAAGEPGRTPPDGGTCIGTCISTNARNTFAARHRAAHARLRMTLTHASQ